MKSRTRIVTAIAALFLTSASASAIAADAPFTVEPGLIDTANEGHARS
ncbi:hypothetical protein [uncultured Martelella sp.]|nr:hypothetical protein [uncultured Martelella sp.]